MQRREAMLDGVGGVPLWGWVQTVDAARGICVLVHGLGEHSGRYLHVAQVLHRQRFTVAALDYRGHGRSGGRRGHCAGFGDLVDDVARLIGWVSRESAAQPIILVGHSLGGLIALTYAVERPHALRAVVASSPALELSLHPPWPRILLAQLVGRLWPTLGVHNAVNPAWLSHDPAVVTAYRTDPLVHHTITLGGYLATRRAMARMRPRATEVAVPCLLLQAGEDRLVSVEASRQFARAVRSPGSAYREYAGFSHELFNEVGRDQVFRDLEGWVAAQGS